MSLEFEIFLFWLFLHALISLFSYFFRPFGETLSSSVYVCLCVYTHCQLSRRIGSSLGVIEIRFNAYVQQPGGKRDWAERLLFEILVQRRKNRRKYICMSVYIFSYGGVISRRKKWFFSNKLHIAVSLNQLIKKQVANAISSNKIEKIWEMKSKNIFVAIYNSKKYWRNQFGT